MNNISHPAAYLDDKYTNIHNTKNTPTEDQSEGVTLISVFDIRPVSVSIFV